MRTCEAAALGNSIWAICTALTECLWVFPITSLLGPAQRLSELLKEVYCGKQFYFDDWSRHLFRQSRSSCIGSFDLCCSRETTQCMLLLYLLLLAEVLEFFFFMNKTVYPFTWQSCQCHNLNYHSNFPDGIFSKIWLRRICPHLRKSLNMMLKN